jgi:hypothetical protein
MPKRKKTKPIPIKIEFSTGKRCYDSGNTRYLLRDLDRTIYARRCLGCGNADKIYQSTHHVGGCPHYDPDPDWKFFLVRGFENDDTLELLSGGFQTWGEADAYGSQSGHESGHRNAYVKQMKIGEPVQINPDEAAEFFGQN